VRYHRKAVELLGRLPVDGNPGYLADLGTAWVNLGCALLAGLARDCAEGALGAFDRAIVHLERLPIATSSRFRHNLAAAWMNRADALTRAGNGESHDEALAAYTRAIEIAGGLVLDEKPSFRVLLASCRINLGNLHHRFARLDEAIVNYDGAVTALGNLPRSGHRLACHHAATAWTNRGEALLAKDNIAGAAAESARMALGQFEGRSLDGAAEAKLSLRALGVMARGLESAVRVARSVPGADAIAELTDIAERGFGIALAHRDRAPDVFDPFISWFFSFGSRIYGRYQPQFLAEYLDEGLRRWDAGRDPGLWEQLRIIARQATAGTLESLSRNRLVVAGTRETERLLETVQGLRNAAAIFNS
jgi:tetratricopeptide (TPR) repeat protein